MLEEADKSHYWLEMVKKAELKTGIEVDRLIKEANELTAIFAATDKTNKSEIENNKIKCRIPLNQTF